MTDNNEKKIIGHLESIEKMLAFLVVKDLETAKDRIIRLHKVGMSPTSMSGVLGVTTNYVNVTLSNARKSGEI